MFALAATDSCSLFKDRWSVYGLKGPRTLVCDRGYFIMQLTGVKL